MTSPLKQVRFKWMITWLPILAMAGTGLIAWGQTNEKIKRLEARANTAQEDHDRIVRIETQITIITDSVNKLVENDEKLQTKLDEAERRLERTIQNEFNTLLQELRNRPE